MIARPFSPKLSRLNKALRITSIWAISILMNTPFIMSLNTSNGSCSTTTLLSPTGDMVLVVCQAFVGWFLPSLILALCYINITRQLRYGELHHDNAQVVLQQIRLENKKVVRMFTIIVCIYLVLTLPFAMLQIVQIILIRVAPNLLTPSIAKHLISLYLILPNVTVLNSCVNPVVYAKMHKDINRFLRGIWRKMGCRLLFSPRVSRSVHQVSSAPYHWNQTFTMENLSIINKDNTRRM